MLKIYFETVVQPFGEVLVLLGDKEVSSARTITVVPGAVLLDKFRYNSFPWNLFTQAYLLERSYHTLTDNHGYGSEYVSLYYVND